jgi:hypothetical protein
MPATGTYAETELLQGPGDVYLMPTASAPATGQKLVITAGKPPDGLLLGYTTEGTRLVGTVETTGITADESATPLKKRLDSELWAIEGTAMQIADTAYLKLQALIPQGRIGAPGFTFGGSASYAATAEYAVVVVFPTPSDTTKYGYAILYKARNIAEFAAQISRVQEANVDFRFEGETVGTRPKGDQVGSVMWDSTITPAATEVEAEPIAA